MERAIGFKLDDLVDMTGDETAIAITIDPGFKLDTTNGVADELSSFGLVYAIAVKDDAKAKMVLAKLRAQLETPDAAKIVKVRHDRHRRVGGGPGDRPRRSRCRTSR